MLKSTPVVANVVVGDALLGATPLAVVIPFGLPSTILFEAAGYTQCSHQVLPVQGDHTVLVDSTVLSYASTSDPSTMMAVTCALRKAK